jgi:release factor glutamine methyltransferase
VATIAEEVGAARQRLQHVGILRDEADIDARLLAEHVLGWTTERFLTHGQTAASDSFTSRYAALVQRRAGREPVAYIVGHQEFWGLEFEVSPGVLIPRPETELVVESALALFPASHSAPAKLSRSGEALAGRLEGNLFELEIADICTGSGCIAVAIARNCPSARITATDVSDAALEVARRNAVRHQVADRVAFRRADLFAGIGDTFDVVAANPPYVPEVDKASLQPEVRDHEPPLALFAGPDGLRVIRRLVSDAPDRLRPGGRLIFEFGFGQAGAVAELISRTPGLKMIELRPDLQGIPRVAIAQRT